jgi:hypothetical protein
VVRVGVVVLYLRLPEDGALTPKCVGAFTIQVQFVILLCVSAGKCD